ncbi:hypothetical protein Barb6_02406 [Bacteroidales bacterium Barb6]|nr:hypothetical protein Barb6_02406 [Bacteroidales bacterium Barb6]
MRNVRYLLSGWSLSLTLGLAAWAFFGIFYRHHLHYQEQLQLFLTTSDYLVEQVTARPGGLAAYIGGFFTQFFYDSLAGAFGLALLLVALQRLTADAANHISPKPLYRELTCIPSIAYAALLCNEDFLAAGLAALVLAMSAVYACNRIKGDGLRQAYMLLMVPVLYGLAGTACAVFLIAALSAEWLTAGKRNKQRLAVVTLTALLLFVLSPLAAKLIVVQYPMRQFWLAGDYYRFVREFPVWLLGIFLLTALLPLLYKILPEKQGGKWVCLFIKAGKLLLLALLSVAGVSLMADWAKEEVMAYDYYARSGKWNNIIAMADRKAPTSPLTVATLNLALAQTGYLPDYMFTYFQNGTEGLLPTFSKDYIVSVMAGEIYYRLGLVNTAQRFAFEAMEAIPDYNKSVRCLKRLAETNLINGQYKVAAKYLAVLQHTLFYKKQAVETEWGQLRQFRPQEDFLFSDREKDMMLGILFQHNPANRAAYEYLLAYTLLSNDLPHFLEYYQMGERAGMIPEAVPRAYQEALALVWSQTQYNPALKPPRLSDDTVRRLEAYRKASAPQPNPAPALKSRFGDTYWYYYYN